MTCLKISERTKERAKRIRNVIIFVLSWVSVVLYIWDDVSGFLAYKYWTSFLIPEGLRGCFDAWLVMSCIGVPVTVLVAYNTLCCTIKCLSDTYKTHHLKHQYTVFIAYFLHEIPKSITYLVIMSKYNIDPDEQSRWKTTRPSRFLLGQSKYDHVYFKVITDILKMVSLFVLSVIEFREITRKDKNKVFMTLNYLATISNVSILIAATVVKVVVETKE